MERKKPRSKSLNEKLTPKQELFVKHFVACNEAKKAYLAAGFKSKQSNEGYKLLQQPKIKKAIAAIVAPKLKKLDIDANRTLEAMGHVAFLDPRKAFREDGSMVPIHELPAEVAAAISGITVRQTEFGATYEYKFNDRCKAHDSLAKHFGMYKPEEVNVNQRVTVVFE